MTNAPTHDDLTRTPLLSEEGTAMLRALREHPDAPRWNYAVGDRLIAEDLPRIDAFRNSLATRSQARRADGPPTALLPAIAAAIARVPWYRQRIGAGVDFARDWESLPTASRRDIAAEPWLFVPDDAPLDRLVIYRTAGTTGHPIEVPHHPRAVACYQPLIEAALAAYGVRFRATRTPQMGVSRQHASCFLVSAQVKTYTYATVLSAWNGAGFAKVNLRASEWPSPASTAKYFETFAPRLITGEPVAFTEMLRREIPAHPVALISTSLRLSSALRARLATAYGCPVIDWYSTVETGPIAFACPHGAGFHLLPHDLHIETLRPDGSRATPDERGEVTVTGGRNPYFPLIRYRTGDFALLTHERCACGDDAPRLLALEGRRPILFRAADDTPIGAVDISRLLRAFPLTQHAFLQRADRSCRVAIRPRTDAPTPDPNTITTALHGLFGAIPIDVEIDPRLGDDPARPAVPFQSAFDIEEDSR